MDEPSVATRVFSIDLTRELHVFLRYIPRRQILMLGEHDTHRASDDMLRLVIFLVLCFLPVIGSPEISSICICEVHCCSSSKPELLGLFHQLNTQLESSRSRPPSPSHLLDLFLTCFSGPLVLQFPFTPSSSVKYHFYPSAPSACSVMPAPLAFGISSSSGEPCPP